MELNCGMDRQLERSNYLSLYFPLMRKWRISCLIKRNEVKYCQRGYFMPWHNVSLDDELKKTLANLKKSAQKGNKIAKQAYTLANKTVRSSVSSLEEILWQVETEPTDTANTKEKLSKQLNKLKNDLQKIPPRLKNNIAAHSDAHFTISLFGPTTAGKSTLREILTNGDGKSIGNGAQRTTRDVRRYYYSGLEIYDVPGTSAYDKGGREDEKIAFENAQKADLILFLTTNDPPQADEMDWFTRIISLGKPVICIINVKRPLSQNMTADDWDDFYYDLDKKMESKEIDDLKKQFLKFAGRNRQDWRHVKFVYAHLLAAFLSRKPQYAAQRRQLERVSRFSYLERKIKEEVIANGHFYKLKSYVDSITIPLTELFDRLFEYSVQNSEHGQVLADKQQKFSSVIQELIKKGEASIDSFAETLTAELTDEIADFSENHYQDKKAESAWNHILQHKHIERRAQEILSSLEEDCNEKLKQLKREIKKELLFTASDFKANTLNMPPITNWKKRWNWGTTIASSGLAIAAMILGSNPLGWALGAISAAVGVGGWLLGKCFDSKEEKAAAAREELQEKLTKHIDQKIYFLRKQMKDMFYTNLINKLKEANSSFYALVGNVYKLSNIQQELASTLNANIKQNNKELLQQAVEFLGNPTALSSVKEIIRDPGRNLMFLLQDGTRFPEDITRQITHLMKEKVYFTFDNNNLKSLLRQALGKSFDKNIYIQYIQDKPRIAHIKTDVKDLSLEIRNRIPLAQQLTELLIMK